MRRRSHHIVRTIHPRHGIHADRVSDTLAEKFVAVNSLDRVVERNHRSVLDWVIDNVPLEGEEDNFLFDPTDFVYARQTSGSGKDRTSRIEEAIESYLQRYPKSWLHVSCGISGAVYHKPNVRNRVILTPSSVW